MRSLALLEDQMCRFTGNNGSFSPDRVDALVWALTELVLEPRNTGLLDFLGSQAARKKQAALKTPPDPAT